MSTDKVKFSIVTVDLDVDSDNTNGYNYPDRSTAEDGVEDTGFGKLVPASTGDADDDGVPDFADGYNRDGISSSDDCGGQIQFVPIVLELPAPINVNQADVWISYGASDPSAVSVDANGSYSIGQPGIRIWNAPGYACRSAGTPVSNPAGNYVAPGFYTLAQLGALNNRTVTLYIEESEPWVAYSDGSHIYVIVDLDGTGPISGPEPTDVIRVTPLVMDLDVDANRDVAVDQRDEQFESTWTTGPASSGAIVLPNFDRDNAGIAPDNWTGGDWDLNGTIEPPNRTIDNSPDIADLAPLHIRKLGLETLPDDLIVSLTAELPAGDNSFFSSIAPQSRIRVFMPAAGASAVQPGDDSVIGPEAGATAVFVKAPAVGEHSFDVFAGAGTIAFAIEGIEQGAAVDLRLRVTLPAVILREDVVRVRVAPFVLNDHRDRVAPGPGETVYVEALTEPPGNAALRARLNAYFGADRVAETPLPPNWTFFDPWHQDGYEIGYAKSPYGSMAVVLQLNRSYRFFSMVGAQQVWDRAIWIRTQLLKAGVGVNTRIETANGGNSQNSGGNIEGFPRFDQPGWFLHGDQMDPEQTDFFAAQAVNDSLPIKTSWLSVGHVDEVVSPASNGTKTVIADPEVAWGLLLWADKVSQSAPMHQSMNGNTSTGVTVHSVVTNAALRDANFGPSANAPMHPDNLLAIRQAIRTAMGIGADGAETAPQPAGGALSKGGAFVGFFPNNFKRHYKLTFTSSTQYIFSYKQDGAATYTVVGTGRIDRDEVFPAARAFVLKHWWQGTPAVKSVFTYSADPTYAIIEMPVLFHVLNPAVQTTLNEYTTNHVNALVDGQAVISGKACGPVVDRDGTGMATDILQDYARAMFIRAGYDPLQIYFEEARFYHNQFGNVHCGTNSLRSQPSFQWWNK